MLGLSIEIYGAAENKGLVEHFISEITRIPSNLLLEASPVAFSALQNTSDVAGLAHLLKRLPDGLLVDVRSELFCGVAY